MLGTTCMARCKQCLFHVLACLACGLLWATPASAWQAASGPGAGPGAADARHGAAAPQGYRVINLRPGGIGGITTFNDKDQVAISLYNAGGVARGYFYDGSSLRDIGTLGGTQTFVTSLNNAGEVAGYSYLAGDTRYHAFRWSQRGGMRDLGTLDGIGDSSAGVSTSVNEPGQVVGSSTIRTGTQQAFLWSPRDGMRNLGSFPGDPSGYSYAHAINDDGLVGGQASTGNAVEHAFVWTRRSGMRDIDPYGGAHSTVWGLTDDGLVGGQGLNLAGQNRVFIWTQGGGVRDLGTAGFAEAYVNERGFSTNGHVAGFIRQGEIDHAAVWLRGSGSGLFDIGTLGGPISFATGINNKAHAIGMADRTPAERTPIIWTARDGLIDLNSRLRMAPPGLVVDFPFVISNSGVILANSSAGFILLKPEASHHGTDLPTVGPIAAPDMVEVGAPLDATVTFAGPAPATYRNIVWSWGDASAAEQSNARTTGTLGQASASHRYAAPGIYTLSAQVSDRDGLGPAVSRTVVAYQRGAGSTSASGWFTSPAGAQRALPDRAGRAVFNFLAADRAGAASSLLFQAGTLHFRSDTVMQVLRQGTTARYQGTGTVNGAAGHAFTLNVTAGTTEPHRFGLTISHRDPATGAGIVDYDNQAADRGSVVPATQGAIVLQ